MIGLLHVGDIIKEINGQDVDDPDQLTDMMKKSSGSVTLKVLPSYYDTGSFSQVSDYRYKLPHSTEFIRAQGCCNKCTALDK